MGTDRAGFLFGGNRSDLLAGGAADGASGF